MKQEKNVKFSLSRSFRLPRFLPGRIRRLARRAKLEVGDWTGPLWTWRSRSGGSWMLPARRVRSVDVYSFTSDDGFVPIGTQVVHAVAAQSSVIVSGLAEGARDDRSFLSSHLGRSRWVKLRAGSESRGLSPRRKNEHFTRQEKPVVAAGLTPTPRRGPGPGPRCTARTTRHSPFPRSS